MNLQQKEHVIASLKHGFKGNLASFVIGFRGLTVAEFNDLRRKVKKTGGSIEVAKKTLIKRSLGTLQSSEEYSALLKDQVALVFADNQGPAIAKILCDFAKDHERCVLLTGLYDSRVLMPSTIKVLASLPSREVLLAQVAGTLKAPISKLPFILQMLVIRMVFVLKQIAEKKAVQA
jgi:large subunit ribosomal protein L10